MTVRDTRVVQVDGTRVTVGVDSAAACSGCRSQTVCGSAPNTLHQLELPAAQAASLRPGDLIALGVDDDAPLRAVMLAYLPPLAGLLGGIGAGSVAGLPDVAVLACGGSGLCFGAVIARLLAGHWRDNWRPRICGRRD
ncbi:MULTISPECIES: SoxR reducing system RseC family protein [Methyloversatilis]|uniref:SoxR reducing system RseC family protein n=1 Tax=Methyloversatilis TaxID=378210 RepID=UPI0026ED85C0|nr:SoxR reducing system RseC family protein [Methyloversatilis discipulorum]MBV5286523.1 SoxR reducing system RseC family protein [Methyloversatilis discipulorum]